MIVTSHYWNCFCSSTANSEASTDQNLKYHYKLKAQTIIKLGRASSKLIWVFRRKLNNIYQRIYLNTKQSSHKWMEPCVSTKTSFPSISGEDSSQPQFSPEIFYLYIYIITAVPGFSFSPPPPFFFFGIRGMKETY